MPKLKDYLEGKSDAEKALIKKSISRALLHFLALKRYYRMYGPPSTTAARVMAFGQGLPNGKLEIPDELKGKPEEQ